MRVIINIEPLFSPLTGVGHYVRELGRRLRQSEEVDALHGFTGLRWTEWPHEGGDTAPPMQRPSGLRPLLRPIAARLPFLRTVRERIAGAAFRRGLAAMSGAVYHEPNYVSVPWEGATVLTVHDLSHLHYPEFHPRDRIRHLERGFPRSLRDAAHVITVSEFVRRELIDQLGVAPGRVTAIHNGVGPHFGPTSASVRKAVLHSYGLEEDHYLLSVATLEPRKNLGRLIEAFERLPAKTRRGRPLVLIGGTGWRADDLLARIAAGEARGEIRRLGYVPDDALPALYAGASAFAYVSLYEGFGLPVAEAMACGCPVVTSGVSGTGEVAGDAARCVDPRDGDAVHRALIEILDDDALRSELRARGLERAAAFTWEQTTAETLAVYRQALGIG